MTCNESSNEELAGTDERATYEQDINSSSTPRTPLSNDIAGFRAEDSRNDDNAFDDMQMCQLYEKRLSWADMCEDMSDDEVVRSPVHPTAASPRTEEMSPKTSSRSSRVSGLKYSTGNNASYCPRVQKGGMLTKPFYKKLESVQIKTSDKFRRKLSQADDFTKVLHDEIAAAVNAFDFSPLVRSQLEESIKEHLTSVNEEVLAFVKQQASVREAKLELAVQTLLEEAASTQRVVEGLRKEVDCLQTKALATALNEKDILLSERIESLAADLTELRGEMCHRDAVFAEALKTIKASQTAQAPQAAPAAPAPAFGALSACATAASKASPRGEPRRRHTSRLTPEHYASSPTTPTTPSRGVTATTQPGGPFPFNSAPLSSGSRRLSRGTNKPPTAPASPHSSTPASEPPQTPTRATHPSPALATPNSRTRRGKSSATSAANAIEGVGKVHAASQSPGLAQRAQKVKVTTYTQQSQPADVESSTKPHKVVSDFSLSQMDSARDDPPSHEGGPASYAASADLLVSNGLATEC